MVSSHRRARALAARIERSDRLARLRAEHVSVGLRAMGLRLGRACMLVAQVRHGG
jgi:hypothetical protein